MATAWEAAVGEPAADSDRGGRRWCEELLCTQNGALLVLDLEDAVERQVAALADELREGVEIDRLGVRSGALAPGPGSRSAPPGVRPACATSRRRKRPALVVLVAIRLAAPEEGRS
jgi:hypothetical protein